jgi:flagellar hook protein FlgE
MSNYNVAYSGLDNVSKAIDAVSNNIANASTVGYKAGQWVFADQFMKATSTTDAARTGMGTQNLSVRRPMIQGAIANSTNPLDLAISGNGMFRLLQDLPRNNEDKLDPSSLFYTRNGQFSVSKDGYIVNENGMYLTGYQPDRYGKAITDDIYGNWGLLKVPEANYFGNKTGSSVISALLDSTSTAFTSTTSTPFDPSQNTFNNKTSQTIFDNDGNAHTLDVYYRRIADSTFTIKSESDGTGYTYAPSKSSTPSSAADIDKKISLNANSVLRVDTAPLATAAVGTTVTIGVTSLTLNANPDANVSGKRVFLNGVDTGYVVANDPVDKSPLTLTRGSSPEPSGNGNVTFNQKDIVTFYDVSGTNTLNMTLVTPDGHEILVQGKSNMPSSGLDLTAVESRVEVYSSIDGQFFDHNATSDYFSNRQASQAEMQVSASAYKPVTVMHFVGGRNIDALVTDPLSGNPKFRTDVTLSAKVTNQALGTSQLLFNLDLTDTTMQSGPFQISKSYQDGEAFAKLSNLTIDNEGRIAGVYGGGRVQYVGQIALVHFDAFEAMAPVGKNAFAATVESGTEDSANGVYRGRPGTGQLGEIRSQALESSNVDLSGELVRLMILQRTYSANSQSMKAVDQVMRDTLQMIS